MDENAANGDKGPAETSQGDHALKFYLRLNLIFMALVTLVAAAFTLWRPTAGHIAGLILASALTISTFFVGRLSQRGYGFIMLAVAALFAVTAQFARADWGMEPYEFGVGAVSIGAIALGLIFTNKKTGETDARVEDRVGAFVLLSLLVVAAAVVWHGASTFAHPVSCVFMEGLAALADVAGERWKGRLAYAAVLPIAAIVADHVQPAWPRVALDRIEANYRVIRAHSHSWQVWAPLFAGMSSLINSLNRRTPWRVAVARMAGIVVAIWLLLVVADISFG